MVNKFYSMDDSELEAFLFKTEVDKDGMEHYKLNTRPIADLAVALEKVHCLCYMALSDTAGDRGKRGEEDVSTVSTGQLHATLAEAMAKVRETPPGIAGRILDARAEITSVSENRPEGAPAAADRKDFPENGTR
jgi:hypothetical protein